ncbi:Alpha/Beta hydrolase protein [Xylariales sp. AK1849]|nr:Alpha/Beta hydrolase protein [Xylariales sp. AK1849]
MEYAYTTANDGCSLAFQTSLPLSPASFAAAAAEAGPRYRTLILLIHGFSGSSEYFKHNFASLSAVHWVVAPDLRGHGKSGRPRGGYHVARLAADLKDLITYLRASCLEGEEELKIFSVGCSIGAAILWTYVELFSDGDFAGCVFVDQAPLQDRSSFDAWDDSKAHRGCYDEKSMLAAQTSWIHDSENAYKGLVADCLGYRYAPRSYDNVSAEKQKEDEDFFTGISRQCDPVWLARLLADHTRYDHREACEEIRVAVLVIMGERTGCFPLPGMGETIDRVTKGRMERPGKSLVKRSVFDSGHWLFYEAPDLFDERLLGFVEECIGKK